MIDVPLPGEATSDAGHEPSCGGGTAVEATLSGAVYLHSGRIRFDQLVCDDAGPGYAAMLGLQADVIGSLQSHAADGRIVMACNRLAPDEWRFLVDYKRRHPETPLVAKLVDPCYPKKSLYQHLEALAECEGTAFVSVYEPAEVVADFFDLLRAAGRPCGVVPYPYLPSRQLDAGQAGRRNRVILTGSMDRSIYPLRTALRDRRRRSLALRRAVDVLPHAGYPDIGERPRHDLTHAAFVGELSRYRAVFLCP